MDESVTALTNNYLCLLAWFITGMPNPFMKEAYRVKAEIEIVLRKLTESQLTGVELARCAKDKYRDPLSEEQSLRSATRLLHGETDI